MEAGSRRSDPVALPIVDLAEARDPELRLAVAKQLVRALETVGFLYVYDAQRLLAHAHWFFRLSDVDKQWVSRKLWNPESHNHYRGYFPLQPGEISYKEGFEVGQGNTAGGQTGTDLVVHPFFTESNLWPEEAEGAQQFKQGVLQHYEAMQNCGSEILRLVSLGCGLPEDWFQSMFFPGSLSTLRLLHYPPRSEVPDVARSGDTILCCSEHSDSGFVPLLATFRYGGLEIRKESGEWWAVPCRPDSLVTNIGDVLSAISGGKFKATRHHVVDTRYDRFSVPFFFEPRYDADITKVMPLNQDQRAAAEVQRVQDVQGWVSKETTYGPWLIDKMRSFAEYRDILDSLLPASI